MRAVLVLVALSASCTPSPDSPSGLRLALSAAGIASASLSEVRVIPAEGSGYQKAVTLSSVDFWKALDESGTAGHRCCCIMGTIQLFTTSNRVEPAASIVIHDGEGMKLKAGGRVVEFESEALREAVRRRLELSAKL